MAQWTVALDARIKQPDGSCEVRVRTRRVDARGRPLYVTMVLRDGETVRSDDPDVVAALSELLTAGAGRTKVFNTLVTRPASPTYDVDTRTSDPLPDATMERSR